MQSATSDHASEGSEVRREAMTMALYVSIVLIATFAALPSGADADAGHHVDGVHGIGLIALIWGTSIGLAVAHFFAFRLSAKMYGGGSLSSTDARIGGAQLGAAALVATLCSIPVLIADDASDVGAASFVPAILIGMAGFAVARAGGGSRTRALVSGGIALAVGLAVAVVKNFLAGH